MLLSLLLLNNLTIARIVAFTSLIVKSFTFINNFYYCWYCDVIVGAGRGNSIVDGIGIGDIFLATVDVVDHVVVVVVALAIMATTSIVYFPS